jgi:GNAT superfamily N-acetyltransferase
VQGEHDPAGDRGDRGFEVRRAHHGDVEALVELMGEYCAFYSSDPGAQALADLALALLAEPDRDGVQLLACPPGEPPVGFATVFWTWSTTRAERIAIMNDLYVVPAWRGRAVADALIEACRRLAGSHGAARLTWQTAPDNLRAQAVYDRVGGQREQWVDYWLEADPPGAAS